MCDLEDTFPFDSPCDKPIPDYNLVCFNPEALQMIVESFCSLLLLQK